MTGTVDAMSILDQMDKSPAEVAASLQAFSESARVLSSSHPRLIDEYPDRWIAVFHGAVRADADTLEEVLTEIDEARIPRSDVIVRFIEREPRSYIL